MLSVKADDEIQKRGMVWIQRIGRYADTWKWTADGTKRGLGILDCDGKTKWDLQERDCTDPEGNKMQLAGNPMLTVKAANEICKRGIVRIQRIGRYVDTWKWTAEDV